jgi:hypothetical protein
VPQLVRSYEPIYKSAHYNHSKVEYMQENKRKFVKWPEKEIISMAMPTKNLCIMNNYVCHTDCRT